MSALTFSNGKTLEAVKADTWISQSESKHRVRKVKENRRKELEQEPVAPLAKPESWGKVETVTPTEQCPPRKKGRKPKKTEHAEENQDVEKTTTRKRKAQHNKGSKSKKTKEEEMQPDAPAKRAKVEVKASSDPRLTPSQRTGAYLREKKREREAEEVAARPTKTRKGGKAEPENAAKKKDKGKASKTKGDGCTTTKGSRGKKEKTPEEVAARKAQLSRKSSAYHVAFRAAKGTLEERKEVAKKAPRRK